jgi:hypothetical protein
MGVEPCLRCDVAGDGGGGVDVPADGHAGAYGPLVIGQVAAGCPDAENGVVSQHAGAVPEFVRGFFPGAIQQAVRTTQTVRLSDSKGQPPLPDGCAELV